MYIRTTSSRKLVDNIKIFFQKKQLFFAENLGSSSKCRFCVNIPICFVQCLVGTAYHQIVTIKISKTVTIWEFSSSVFIWQFLKISQKIAKRNYLVVGTVLVLHFRAVFVIFMQNPTCTTGKKVPKNMLSLSAPVEVLLNFSSLIGEISDKYENSYFLNFQNFFFAVWKFCFFEIVTPSQTKKMWIYKVHKVLRIKGRATNLGAGQDGRERAGDNFLVFL